MSSRQKLTAALRYIDTWLDHQLFLDQQTPGYSIAISYKGNVILRKAAGFADLNTKEKMRDFHQFRIASLTKNFTAVAILQLIELGKLSLKDTISQHLPFLSDNKDLRVHQVTVQDLLSHSSGSARDGADSSFWKLHRSYPYQEEIVNFYRNNPLVLNRAERFKYSNYGFALLGILVEKVSNLTYSDYLIKNILAPLSLNNTGFNYDRACKIVTGHTGFFPDVDQASISANLKTNGFVSAAGLYSDATDLCKFYMALMSGSQEILSESIKSILFSPNISIPDEGVDRDYSLGFVCDREYYNRILYGHAGTIAGQVSRVLFDIEDNIVVTVLANSFAGKVELIQKGIWNIIAAYFENFDPQTSFLSHEGEFYDLWGCCYFTPMGDKVYVTNLTSPTPFKTHSELVFKKDNLFTIAKETGFGSFGEEVEFIFEENKLRRVLYAGTPKMRKSEYSKYLENISDKNKF